MILNPKSNLFEITLTAQKQSIYQWMQQCRLATLSLFQKVDQATFSCQAHPNFSPIGWHLGHIGYTEALWILEHLAGEFPQHLLPYRRLYAADGLPKAERRNLPSLEETLSLLDDVRSRVFQYLSICPLENQERLWRWLLQHESQHCETIAIVLELQKSNPSFNSSNSPAATSKLSPIEKHANSAEMIHIPAGSFQCGSNSINALDNEQPQHEIFLNSYWIDRYPVTQQQYRQFIEAEGYRIATYWHPEGWQWIAKCQIQQPRYWKNSLEYDHYPVCGISWYEADAYARFMGKRLPTEFEWEKAAAWNPTTQQQTNFNWQTAAVNSTQISSTTAKSPPQAPNDCYYMLGNCWEWTSSKFQPYIGFVAYPYKGYSQAYFDNQHYVLRGGSWATLHWTIRPTFRNWYYPQTQEIFSSFRCASDTQ